MEQSKVTMGEVKIELVPASGDGENEALVLKPSLGTALAINSRFGGVVPLLSSLRDMDIQAVGFIIAHGAGKASTAQEVADVTERVWRTGIQMLIGPTIDFASTLMNGGRPIVDLTPGKDPPAGG